MLRFTNEAISKYQYNILLFHLSVFFWSIDKSEVNHLRISGFCCCQVHFIVKNLVLK